jgi:hypothetical protein
VTFFYFDHLRPSTRRQHVQHAAFRRDQGGLHQPLAVLCVFMANSPPRSASRASLTFPESLSTSTFARLPIVCCFVSWKPLALPWNPASQSWKERKEKERGPETTHPASIQFSTFGTTTIYTTSTHHSGRTCADQQIFSGYLPLIIYLGYTRSVPRPSLIKYASFLPLSSLEDGHADKFLRLFSPLAI